MYITCRYNQEFQTRIDRLDEKLSNDGCETHTQHTLGRRDHLILVNKLGDEKDNLEKGMEEE
jgi:hypothetical protein